MRATILSLALLLFVVSAHADFAVSSLGVDQAIIEFAELDPATVLASPFQTGDAPVKVTQVTLPLIVRNDTTPFRVFIYSNSGAMDPDNLTAVPDALLFELDPPPGGFNEVEGDQRADYTFTYSGEVELPANAWFWVVGTVAPDQGSGSGEYAWFFIEGEPEDVPEGMFFAFSGLVGTEWSTEYLGPQMFAVEGILGSAPPSSPLASWRANYFSQETLDDPALETTVWGNTADPDGDGIPNLIEFALSGIPTDPGSAPLPTLGTITIGDDQFLSLTVNKNPDATDLTFDVRTSTDLATWQSGTGHTVVVEDSETTLIVRSHAPIGTGRRFLRLFVSVIEP